MKMPIHFDDTVLPWLNETCLQIPAPPTLPKLPHNFRTPCLCADTLVPTLVHTFRIPCLCADTFHSSHNALQSCISDVRGRLRAAMLLVSAEIICELLTAAAEEEAEDENGGEPPPPWDFNGGEPLPRAGAEAEEVATPPQGGCVETAGGAADRKRLEGPPGDGPVPTPTAWWWWELAAAGLCELPLAPAPSSFWLPGLSAVTGWMVSNSYVGGRGCLCSGVAASPPQTRSGRKSRRTRSHKPHTHPSSPHCGSSFTPPLRPSGPPHLIQPLDSPPDASPLLPSLPMISTRTFVSSHHTRLPHLIQSLDPPPDARPDLIAAALRGSASGAR